MPRTTGYETLKSLKQTVTKGKWPEHLGKDLWTILTDLGPTASHLYTHAMGNTYYPPVTEVYLNTRTEQSPNPESRVSLSESRDPLGLNRIKLHLQFSDLDKQTVRVTNRLVAEELGRLDLGRVKLKEWVTMDDATWPGSENLPDYPHRVLSFGHHMGTTRMSEDPKLGVVDRHCRVHNVSNLYVASSSVFPASGYMNPTLTIVALSLRLAGHIRGQFA
jgi:choline dehydrogenase-like flavoprotein